MERLSREVAEAAFAGFGPNDARTIGEAFLSVSPDDGRVCPTDLRRGERSIEFRVKRVGDEKLATLCRIAGAFDRGLFEAIGVRFANVTWTPGHGDGYCHIRLTDREAAGGA